VDWFFHHNSHTTLQFHEPLDFASRYVRTRGRFARPTWHEEPLDMSMHRMKCRNARCAYEGMMEAKSDQPFVKKYQLDMRKAALKAKGIAPAIEVMQIRCPKCGARFRLRADQLR
jgi:hypothetical protein